MRAVIYEDDQGFLRRALVKDSDSDADAPYLGIPYGPPDVREMDWNNLLKGINNVLVQQSAFTWEEAQRTQQVGLQAALSLFKRALIDLYRDQDNRNGSSV